MYILIALFAGMGIAFALGALLAVLEDKLS